MLIISFILLIASLVASYQNIQTNTQALSYLNKVQVQLTYFTKNLNNNLKKNQTIILQYILLHKKLSDTKITKSFNSIDKSLNELHNFSTTHTLPITFINTLNTIKKRVSSYKIIEKSIVNALKGKDKEDLEDAIIGFNSVIQKFSQDTKALTNLSNDILYTKIRNLKENNKKISITLLFSFFTAFLLIASSIYKFNRFQNDLKEAQKKILKYNEDLEKEIFKKTQELHKRIYTHHITGLPNRNKLLADALSHTFTRMALLKIDRFQSFNDVYGEDVGNIALQLTATFLKEEGIGFSTHLYHIGGDEFVIISDNEINENTQMFTNNINAILQKYEKKVFTYKDQTFQFMMSCGIADTGKNKMLAYADMALKDAKKKNIPLSIFNKNKALDKKYKDDIVCHKKLKIALQNNNILSFFQPITPIQDTNKAVKYESLVRLKDEDGKIISPFKFLEVAKAHRIYYKITERIINNTLNTISKYKIPCSLNLSLNDIQNEHTMEKIFNILNDFNFNELLTVELLETEDFNDYEAVSKFCLKVRSYGAKIALDDFGSGYSNFSHILNLPLDYIKIDASLISNIDKNQNSKLMVETITALARKLNILTIAEFVSSQEILDIVTALGVDYAQGFHLGKPLSIEEYIKS